MLRGVGFRYAQVATSAKVSVPGPENPAGLPKNAWYPVAKTPKDPPIPMERASFGERPERLVCAEAFTRKNMAHAAARKARFITTSSPKIWRQRHVYVVL